MSHNTQFRRGHGGRPLIFPEIGQTYIFRSSCLARGQTISAKTACLRARAREAMAATSITRNNRVSDALFPWRVGAIVLHHVTGTNWTFATRSDARCSRCRCL